MKWAHSLIRLANFEVEGLQKRLKAASDRCEAIEIVIDALDLEAQEEKLRVTADPESGWRFALFLQAWRERRAKAEGDLAVARLEEQGARDALAEAFAELKKVEHVADLAVQNRKKAAAKVETAALDELALRRAIGA